MQSLHFQELKYRIIYTIISLTLLTTVLYNFKTELIYILNGHENNINEYFIYTKLSEVFVTYIQLSFFLSFYITSAVLIIQLLVFLTPGLYEYEYKILKNLSIVIIGNSILTMLFLYFIIIPITWKFFSGFQTNSQENLYGIYLETKFSEYINLIITIFLTTYVIIQTFGIILYLAFINVIKLQSLINSRKFVYIAIIITGAIVTPPDVISQLIVALPLILLYEVFLFIFLFMKVYFFKN